MKKEKPMKKVYVLKTHHDCPDEGEHTSAIKGVYADKENARMVALAFAKDFEDKVLEEYDVDLVKTYYDNPDNVSVYLLNKDVYYEVTISEHEVK